MKVLHLINNLKREGAQIVLFNLVTASKSKLVEHIVCARNPGDQLQKALQEKGIRVYTPERYYGMKNLKQSINFIRDIVTQHKIDLIHAHMADAAFIGRLVAGKCSLPLVITHHGHKITPRCNLACRILYLWLLKYAARYASINVVVSDSVRKSVKDRLSIQDEKITVIVNGIPLPEQNSAIAYRQPDRDKISLVSVGRLVKLKGQHQLIEAVLELKRHNQTVRACLVGDGPLRHNIEQQIARPGLEGNITITGVVDNVHDYLNRADIYISTSYHEGLPIATLEAMAAGVPVIVTDVPGHRDVVEHGVTGLLYQPDDIKSLVEAIDNTLADYDSTKRRIYNAYKMVCDKYSIDASIRAYEACYAQICRPA